MRAANRGMGTSDFGESAGEELATCLVGRLRGHQPTSWPARWWSALPPKADAKGAVVLHSAPGRHEATSAAPPSRAKEPAYESRGLAPNREGAVRQGTAVARMRSFWHHEFTACTVSSHLEE